MKVVLLFGEMGSGKSYLGKRMAADYNFHFIEGDDLAGPEMREAIKGLKIIKNWMIDELVQSLANEVSSRQENVVVSQALYQEQHRLKLIHLLTKAGHDVTPVWVKVGTRQHIRQLLSRSGGWRWVLYWILSKPFFQRPRHTHYVLRNDR